MSRPPRANGRRLLLLSPLVVALACQAHALVPVPLAERSVASVATLPSPPPADVKAPETPLTGEQVVATENAVLAGEGAAPVAATRWDRKTPPTGLDAVLARYGLSATEIAHLQTDGFVVLGRERNKTYNAFYWDIHRAELPLYVSMDSLFHALYSAYEDALAGLEDMSFWPRLAGDVTAMRKALPAAASHYLPNTKHDLDLYLRVAEALFDYPPTGNPRKKDGLPKFASDTEVSAFVERAKTHAGLWKGELFGRPRVIDFGGFAPRGHYGREEGVAEEYFEGAMWLSRIELNVVSRSSRSSSPSLDPRETPREALDAFALADLSRRAGVDQDLADVDQTWGRLSGMREDMAPSDLLAVAREAGDPRMSARDAFDRLKATIGDRFPRTVRTHFTPSGTTTLPATATLLPPRIVPDSVALSPLSTTPDAADLGYLLGQERARVYLAAGTSEPQLGLGRGLLRSAPHEGVYGKWLDAVTSLAEPPRGPLPSFMSTPAFADLRLNTTVAAFGQLRHAHVLVASEAFNESGCRIPYGYVEPAPAALERLIAVADEAAHVFDVPNKVVPDSRQTTVAGFTRMAQSLRVLRKIVQHELEGRPLTETESLYLAEVAEGVPVSPYREQRMHVDGWYFRMFASGRSARRPAAFVTDYFFDPDHHLAAYVGADEPRLGVFVVDVAGAPRVVVGPVAHAYERHDAGPRLNDESDAPPAEMHAPWSASYEVPDAPESGYLTVKLAGGTDAFVIDGATLDEAARGAVRVEEVDVHERPCGGVDVTLDKGPMEVVIPPGACERNEHQRGLRVRKGGVVVSQPTFVSNEPPVGAHAR